MNMQIWSLLLASSYLKVEWHVMYTDTGREEYSLKLTNKEVCLMFRNMIEGWFKNNSNVPYNNFIMALLLDDVDSMNEFMNDIALESFFGFDTAKDALAKNAPEHFYQGYVLGSIVELSGRYIVTSNRESGFGRCGPGITGTWTDAACFTGTGSLQVFWIREAITAS